MANAIKQTIKEFILEEFLPGEDPDELTETTPLITGGILDSIATLKLVLFLEERFGITLEAHEADPEHLDTIADIARLVVARSVRHAMTGLSAARVSSSSAAGALAGAHGGRRARPRARSPTASSPRSPTALRDRLRALGVRAGRPRRDLPAQVDRRGRRDLRHPEGRRRLRAGRSGRAAGAQRLHPAQLRGQGGRHGAALRADAARRAASSSGTLPALLAARRGRRRRRPARGARRARTRSGRRRPPRRAPCRAGRPRLHPLHLGLDREAQGRDALARERRELRRLVLRGVRAAAGATASRRTRRFISICRSSTSTCRSSTARRWC